MRNEKLKKVIAMGVIVTSVTAFSPIGASAKGKPKTDTTTTSTEVIDSQSSTIAIKSLKLDKKNLKLIVGKTDILSAKIAPTNATNKAVTWLSSNPEIASVDENGQVTAVAAGTATITCTAADGSGKTATATVKVSDGKILAKAIVLNKKNLKLVVGNTDTLTAKIAPTNATTTAVTWSSSNPEIATVDENGKVTAIAVGTAIITCAATDGSGKLTTSTIKVIDGKVKVKSIVLNQRKVKLAVGNTDTVTAKIAPTNATTTAVTWASSNPEVANVDENGSITAVAAGTATITCAATDDSGKIAVLTVTVA